MADKETTKRDLGLGKIVGQICSVFRLAFSTNNGIYATTAAVALFLIWKLESSEVVEVLKTFINSPLFASLGWILLVASIFISKKILEWRDRDHEKEIARMAAEKKSAQQPQFRQTLLSSEDPSP